jgi:hypothetical protein
VRRTEVVAIHNGGTNHLVTKRQDVTGAICGGATHIDVSEPDLPGATFKEEVEIGVVGPLDVAATGIACRNSSMDSDATAKLIPWASERPMRPPRPASRACL